jgi:predicted dehydrogenase
LPVVKSTSSAGGTPAVVRVGVIGYGYWGPNLARNFTEHKGTSVSAVSDRNPERLEAAKRRYPWIATHEDASAVIADPSIDAVAVATPVATHFEVALAAIRAGKHVLVEKPMTTSSEQALLLIEEARRREVVLMVDHTFVYTGAVRKIHQLISQGRLGKVYYYDSVRVNLGLFQTDVNVIWDLAVHDLSIIDVLMEHKPIAVAAHAVSHVSGHPENLGYVTLYFPDNQLAHLHVNWLAPVKVRTTLIGGRDRMILYDDIEPSEKVKVYDRGTTQESDRYETLVKYRYGDMWAPQLDNTEALQFEVAHFVDCIRRGTVPLTDGWSGLRVVKILETADRSIADRGRAIEIKWPEMT